MGRMFRDFARTMSKWNMREHALTYPSGNQYMRINAQVIATCNGRTMVRVNLYNITRQTDEEEQAVRDGIMKNILYLYDDIALEDLDKDVVELFFLSGSGKAGQTQGKRFGIRKIMEKYVKEIIYPEDRDRYLAYADIETLQERILADGRGYLSDYFRTKGADGNYHWLVHTILVVPKSDYRKYLLISKPAPFEDEKVMKSLRRNYGREFISETIPEELEDEIISAGLLWKNLVEYSHINYFWKDKDRRFVGVSQSFLDYYGMKSEDELIGKTDEEMQWHVSDGPYKSDEEQVISEGVYIHDVPGKCIIRGTLHNIEATKMPIYRDGKIVGLIGYFVDLDSQNMSRKALKQISTVDTVTGLNNIRGLIENMVNYIEEYRKNGSDFVVISVEVEEYVRFREAYGEAEGDSLLRMIAGVLLRTFNHAASLGRFSNGIFYIFYRYQDQKDVSDKVKQIREGINDLHRVGDCVCTCFADIHTEYAASSEDVENMINMLLQKSMENKKVQKKVDA
jgi:diguanylate cyclase (GGDEF)-like protein